MLDRDPPPETPPKDAATLVVVRDAPAGGVEVFCVERQKVGFLGGAVVFPGGKLDPSDEDPAWALHANAPRAPWGDEASRGLAVAACRETLEEAAILPLFGDPLPHAELLEWRARVAGRETTLLALLASARRRLDLASLVPFARWITPAAEPRRYDTRFYLFVGSGGLTGAHDGHETTASFWSPPGEVLRRFDAGELQLVPPTHRTLEILATASTAAAAVVLAESACLEPVCPKLVETDGTVALVLPGDPAHPVAEVRSPGKSRFVLREGRFLPEDPA